MTLKKIIFIIFQLSPTHPAILLNPSRDARFTRCMKLPASTAWKTIQFNHPLSLFKKLLHLPMLRMLAFTSNPLITPSSMYRVTCPVSPRFIASLITSLYKTSRSFSSKHFISIRESPIMPSPTQYSRRASAGCCS